MVMSKVVSVAAIIVPLLSPGAYKTGTIEATGITVNSALAAYGQPTTALVV